MKGSHPAKAGPKQGRDKGGRFKPGHSGNPRGRAPGTRNAATMAAQALLDGEAEALTRKAVALALSGDTSALQLCMARLVPPRKDSPVNFEMPPINNIADACTAHVVVVEQVASGGLTPDEGKTISALIDGCRKSLETEELERRVAALEKDRQR
ncbi:hypothetical protein KJ925_04950 [Patescibacteria group bacterium]|nr:hypothetical protein [Patescibacteria group bacterium]